jgi:uncharacterized protein with HEPN domain
MSEPPAREWRFYLDDMIGFAEKVAVYTEGLDPAGFVASGLNYDAKVCYLELIGEAATHIPEDVRRSNPKVPWRLIIATGNRLIHGYLGIDQRHPVEHHQQRHTCAPAGTAKTQGTGSPELVKWGIGPCVASGLVSLAYGPT